MGNLPTILLLGPSVEERLGSARLAAVIAGVSALIATAHCLLSPDLGLQGASGLVFLLIMVAGGTHVTRSPTDGVYDIPATYALLLALWAGKELLGVRAM